MEGVRVGPLNEEVRKVREVPKEPQLVPVRVVPTELQPRPVVLLEGVGQCLIPV